MKRAFLHKGLGIFLLLTVAVTLLSSCAKTIRFAASSIVPSAEGKVKVKRDDNKNYQIELSIVNLAGPEKLSPPKGTYVVWMNTAENKPKNLGQLNSSKGLFSSTLKADFKTVTPIKPIRIFITAEDVATVDAPGSQVVLSTANFD